jgi:hypothetical protein
MVRCLVVGWWKIPHCSFRKKIPEKPFGDLFAIDVCLTWS